MDEQELAATYLRCSDDDIAALAAEMDTLTEEGRVMLEAEIRRRGLSRAELERLHSRELHREARFDQVAAMGRKKTLLYLLTKNDPKGTFAFIVIAIGFALFAWLRSLFR